MEILNVFKQGIFGLRSAERNFYNSIIQGLQSIVMGYKNEMTSHLSEISSLTQNIEDIKTVLSNYEKENQKLTDLVEDWKMDFHLMKEDYDTLNELYKKATKSFDDMYKRMVPKLSDTQVYELYEIIDPEGWMLLRIVTNLTKTNTNDLYYEDNRGTFENLDGNQLIWWHERMAFAEAEYHIIPGTSYERTEFMEIDKSTNEYMEYMKIRTDELRKSLTNISENRIRQIDPELFNDGLMFLLHTISI